MCVRKISKQHLVNNVSYHTEAFRERLKHSRVLRTKYEFTISDERIDIFFAIDAFDVRQCRIDELQSTFQ